MNHLDPNWIETQHRSFLNWTNSQLRNKNVQLTNLTEDLKSGVHLLELLSELLHKQIPIPITNPQFRIQMMNNLTEALEIIRKDCDIYLLNIDSNDIVDGNTKLVLALIHSLMYKYQVCQAMSDDKNVIDKNTPVTVVEKQLIDWLNSILYNSQPVITNITSDWTSGEHLKNLVHYFLPHNFEQAFESMNSMNPTEKIGESIRLADQELKIPKILEAQDISNGPDQFSMLAYLSYFRMANKKQIPIATTPQPTIVTPQPIITTPQPVIETKPVLPQPTVSSVNFDDVSSAPPMEESPQVNYQQQQQPSMNWNVTQQTPPRQPVQPVQYYPQSYQQNLANSTYLPDQSQQAPSHISSLYSPNNSPNPQLIPQFPPQQQQHVQTPFYGQGNQLMVPPPNMMPQPMQPLMNPYHHFNDMHSHHMMNQYSPQVSPQVSPQISPQQPVIVQTTTTMSPLPPQHVFTNGGNIEGYYQHYY